MALQRFHAQQQASIPGDQLEDHPEAEQDRKPREQDGDLEQTHVLFQGGIASNVSAEIGASAAAAIAALRQCGVHTVTLAIPVGPPGTIAWLAAQADDVICLVTPEPFFAVGSWYRDFSETSDDQVCALLAPVV